MEHKFTKEITKILENDFGKSGSEIFQKSYLIKYINKKTASAYKGSKARSSFSNLYAIYVLVEDYLFNEFDKNGTYSDYDGAVYTALKNKMNALPFGEKLQNHSLNHRMNQEFKALYEDASHIPILRDSKTKRYWINENLLKIKHGTKIFNIASSIKQIIDAYIEAKRKSFNSFLATCEQLKTIGTEAPKKVSDFIFSLLEPNVDARTFEIVSYSILKFHYAEQSIFWGFEVDNISEESLKLYKTGRTNANDGGIDFVMKPLGRFFQVTETTDVKKYFLDIDKIERYPITFVIKSELPEDQLKRMLQEGAEAQFSINVIVKKYIDAIEELINLPKIKSIFKTLVENGKSNAILEEIIQQSRVEFNIE
ncbi:MAG: restriction endonuclease [Aureispira sp.]